MKKSAIWFQYEEEYNMIRINDTQLYCAPYSLSTEDEDETPAAIAIRIANTLEKNNLSFVTIFSERQMVVYKKKVAVASM